MSKDLTQDKNGQLRMFADNGCIVPCPYTSRCPTFGIGCKGECYWCKHYDNEEDKR